MKRWFPWIISAVFAVTLAWAFIYLKDIHPLGALGPKLDSDQLEGVAIRFKDAKLVGRSKGETMWMFEAKTIDLDKDRRLATFRGISRGSLLQDGKQIASLKAGKVVYNVFTRDVATPDTAELQLENGPLFKVRNIYWNSQKSKLLCLGGVDANLDGNTMHGERMTADLANKEVVIHKVSGVIKLEE